MGNTIVYTGEEGGSPKLRDNMKEMTRVALLFSLIFSLILTSQAQAANTRTWYDPANDAVYPAVDILSTIITYDDTDSVGIGLGTGYMIGGDRVSIYVDIDNNQLTGPQGADVLFAYERYIQGDAMLTWVWNGQVWVLVAPQTLIYETTRTTIALSIARQELGSTSAVGVFAWGGHTDIIGTGVSFSDRAPDTSRYSLLFNPPQPLLTLREARNTSARAFRVRGMSSIKVSSSCTLLSTVKRRCSISGTKGIYTWRGRMTVREYALNDVLHKQYIFSGYRQRTGCLRCAKTAVSFRGNF